MPQHDPFTELGESRCIGPPGTGKTHFLSRCIRFDAAERGPENIVALSHTNAAAKELTGRNEILPADNIGTLHSFAYRAIGKPPLVQDEEHLTQFNENVHPRFRVSATADAGRDLELRGAEGDDLLAEYERRRNTMQPLTPRLQHFAAVWEDFKRQVGGVDFCDMIGHALRDVDACPGQPEVLIADEVQDSSHLQLRLLWKWGQRAEKVIFAGDPDQSIYGFSGADPQVFIDHRPDRQRVLSQSYRVPRAVLDFALRWIRQNTVREDVAYEPTDRDGELRHLKVSWRMPDLLAPVVEEALDAEPIADGPRLMILTTCAYMLQPITEWLRAEGVPFANPYRRTQGAWNPLGRAGDGSTVARIRGFLAGLQRAAWTHDELRGWLEMTTGVVAHGRKSTLDEVLTGGEQPADNATLRRLLTPEAVMTLNNPWFFAEEAAEWLAARLLKGRRGVGRYALSIVARHGPEALMEDPAVVVGTVHSVKGGEADRVILFPDLSQAAFAQWQTFHGREEIRRVFYVGATRARDVLYLAQPQSRCAVRWR